MRFAAGMGLVVLISVSCGARTGTESDRDSPDDDGARLVCPAITSCGAAPDACVACVHENLGPCSELDTCDAEGKCEGGLPKTLRCRVDAVEAVECMLTCPFQTCEDVYWEMGRGPTMPVGLAFNDYVCAVCHPCANVCGGTPNFDVVCGELG
ncbi:MAG: hypothetical protein U0414_18740 [Polyangiaceae bacterium]